MMIYLHRSSLTSLSLQDLAAPHLLPPCWCQLPESEREIGRRYSFKAELATGFPAVISR